MRRAVLALLMLLQAAPALAGPAVQQRTCLDPGRPYRATWVSGRDILVTSLVGAHRVMARATTTCIGLDGHARISLSGSTSCLSMGDDVALKRPGEPIQTCKISKVVPVDTQASR